MKKTIYKISGVIVGLLLLLQFQNCSRVTMAQKDTASDKVSDGSNSGSGTGDSSSDSNSGTGTGNGSDNSGGTDTGTGTGETGGGSGAGGEKTPPSNPDRDWLDANCDESEIRQGPLMLDYAPASEAMQLRQVAQPNINISDKRYVDIQQITATDLNINKVGILEAQHLIAAKINIQALEIRKIQQIQFKEMRVHANNITTSFQQIGGIDGSARLQLIAAKAAAVQQVSALCIRTHSTQRIQQISYVKVVGDGSGAKVDEIQQVNELEVVDSDAGIIHQVNKVILRNARVKKVQQVEKLILINSTVDELQQVGSVIHQ